MASISLLQNVYKGESIFFFVNNFSFLDLLRQQQQNLFKHNKITAELM